MSFGDDNSDLTSWLNSGDTSYTDAGGGAYNGGAYTAPDPGLDMNAWLAGLPAGQAGGLSNFAPSSQFYDTAVQVPGAPGVGAANMGTADQYTPAPSTPLGNPPPGGGGGGNWLSQLGSSAWDAVLKNPLQAAGAVGGGALGLAGLVSKSGVVPKTPMPAVNTAQGMMTDQYGRLVPANQAALNNVPGMAANAMSASNAAAPNVTLANQKLTDVLNNPEGNDPALVDALNRQFADKQSYYASRGMLNSDVAQRDLSNFQTQMQGQLAQDRAQRQQIRVGTYSGAATGATGNEATASNTNTNMAYATNPTQVLSALANSGIASAGLNQQVGVANANLANQNRNSLLAAGGGIFGQSIAPRMNFNAGGGGTSGGTKNSLFG